MSKRVLIIGEPPAEIDFDAPDAPPNMSAAKIMDGLNGSVSRLRGAGHLAELLLTKNADSDEGQVSEALGKASYDVIVIGTGLRVLPKMALQFERLINVLREKAPEAKLAFNSQPSDSDAAALRWLQA